MDPLRGPSNAPLIQAGLWPFNQPQSQTPHALSRVSRYATYRAFYEGDQWAAVPAPGERRLTFNYARVFVNKAASYLMGEPVGYEAHPLGPGPRQGKRIAAGVRAVEDYLDQVNEFNNLAEVDLGTVISSGCLGDGAWTVRWDAAAGVPRVTQVQPAGLDARWRADDLRTLLWVRQSYWVCAAELTGPQRARLGDRAGDDPYAPLPAHEEWTVAAWRLLVGDRLIDGGPNPYGVIPYILFPNLRLPGEFWGESDLVDLLALQTELNTRLSIFSRILEVAGNPVAVITGADADSTDTLKLGPNQLWTLPEGAKAEVLDLLKAGGADAHFKYIDTIYRAMHDVSEMPRTSFGDSSGQSTARSGVALQIELQPMLHKLARKRAILTQALERRAHLILTVARLHGVKLPLVAVRPAWPPVLPQDRAALVQQEVTLVRSGIRPPTMAMAALNDPDPDVQLQTVIEEATRLQAAGIQFGGSSFGGMTGNPNSTQGGLN